MRIVSTPPRRYRPRDDFEGPVTVSVGRVDGRVVLHIMADPEDEDSGRCYRIHLSIAEWTELKNTVQRFEDRHPELFGKAPSS